jgi:thioredoxin reductase
VEVPVGLNAAMVLGMARRKIILFDNNKPRNAVAPSSHGFIKMTEQAKGSLGKLLVMD